MELNINHLSEETLKDLEEAVKHQFGNNNLGNLHIQILVSWLAVDDEV